MVVIFGLIISRIALYYKRVKSKCLPSCFGSLFYGAERAKIPFLGDLWSGLLKKNQQLCEYEKHLPTFRVRCWGLWGKNRRISVLKIQNKPIYVVYHCYTIRKPPVSRGPKRGIWLKYYLNETGCKPAVQDFPMMRMSQSSSQPKSNSWKLWM